MQTQIDTNNSHRTPREPDTVPTLSLTTRVANEVSADALVVGRPSARWGQEVVAVVALRPGVELGGAELLEGLRAEGGRHLARYKLPKSVVVRPTISRSPSGKPDYAWARDQVVEDPASS